jgi:hypothetical protein
VGEKGLASQAGEAVTTTTFVTEVTETATGVAADAGSALKDRLIETGTDHVVDEARERWRRHGGEEPPHGST